MTALCFSADTPVSSTNKTDHHDITEILLNIITLMMGKNEILLNIITLIMEKNEILLNIITLMMGKK
jgi:hypothetical protein